MTLAETYILNLGGRIVHDVWTCHLQDRNLVLGANTKAIYIKDIDATRSLQVLDTGSDIFTVQQHDTLVYTGARNGTIARFDMRTDKPHGLQLFSPRYPGSSFNPVTYLDLIRDSEMLISRMNGDLALYDLRFPKIGIPLKTFQGHYNEYTQKLGIAVDPSSNFLFAAGQDNHIRAWSLRTASPILPTDISPSHDVRSSPLSVRYTKPIVAMQITEESEGMCLYVASDSDLDQYWIGQKGC